MKLKLERIVTKVYNKIIGNNFKEQYRMDKNDFTRNRKLTFSDLCILIVKNCKKGVRVSIDEFLEESKSDIGSYSDAAFCKARQKISPKAFKDLCQETVDDFYSEEKAKKFNGYRLLAIDGSDFNLPNLENLIEEYGCQLTDGAPQVQAVCSCLYDVMNEIILDATLSPQKSNERTLAKNHIDYLSTISDGKEILIMDRGYPSEELLRFIEEKGFKYVIRANKDSFFKEIRNITNTDEIIIRKNKKLGDLKIRVLNLKVSEQTTETLLTNITDSNFSLNDFAKIYKMRWNIETKYDELKNKFLIENFTGTNSICIQQDFYATIFLSNLLTYLKLDNEKQITKINKSNTRKNNIQINNSIAIYELKQNVVRLFFAPSKKEFLIIFKNIRKTLINCVLPVRDNRSFKRIHHLSNPFPFNNNLR